MFQPKDAAPEWQKLYDGILATASEGEVIPRDALSEVLGRDFLDNRGPLYRAIRELERRRSLSLSPNGGGSYIVIRGVAMARYKVYGRNRRASRQHQMAAESAAHVDRTGMSDRQRHALEEARQTSIDAAAMGRRLLRRAAHIERLLGQEVEE